MIERIDAFVVCTPGLEALVATEIEKLGIRGPRARHGGVDCSVTLAQLWSLNLRLRVATRVLVRVARFPADTFSTLQAGLRRIDWARWLGAGAVVELKVAASNSKLFHTGAIADRADDVFDEVGYTVVAERPADGVAQVVHLRVTRDVVLVSIDATGDPLYRRGWRLATAKAPMRETLAAALLCHSGWDRKAPLVDPMCGSGTIVIEAALAATRRAAGRNRSFAFQGWPSYDDAGWTRMLAGADADVVGTKTIFVGADRDEGAIAAARANAERAGIAEHVEFRVGAISDFVVPPRTGWLVTNPPYGQRIGEAQPVAGPDLRDLYDRFKQVLVERAAGWHVEIASGDPVLDEESGGGRPLVDRLGLVVEDRLRTSNGGLPIELVRATVPVAAA